jgi:hypothetical protein
MTTGWSKHIQDNVWIFSVDTGTEICFFVVFHFVLCFAADSVASETFDTLDDGRSDRKHFTHSRKARRHMAMPRVRFEATTLVTIISDMSGIAHCPGVIVPQYFKNWVCVRLHVLGRFLIRWAYYKELACVTGWSLWCIKRTWWIVSKHRSSF